MTHSHIVAERIDAAFEQSDKHGFRFCRGCTSHIHLDDLRQNDGYCPGCDAMAEVQQNIRGAL